MPRSQIHQRPGPRRPPAPRSGGYRSGRRARRKQESSGGNAGSKKAKSTGCASSKGSPLATPVNSSSPGEEEESDVGRAP
jgi:hypothetical protein